MTTQLARTLALDLDIRPEGQLLMKFDDQKWQPGIEALAGSIRLKARLLICYYRI